MAKKVISYKLTSNGEIPSFVENGGYLAKGQTWQEMVLIGVSSDNASFTDDVTVYETEQDLVAYLETYLTDETSTDPITGQEYTFSVVGSASSMFAKLI
jgi:hypothetical protein